MRFVLLIEAFGSDPFTSQSWTRKDMDQYIIDTNINIHVYIYRCPCTLPYMGWQSTSVTQVNPLSALSGKLVQCNATQSALSTSGEQRYCVRVSGCVSVFLCTHTHRHVCVCVCVCVCACVRVFTFVFVYFEHIQNDYVLHNQNVFLKIELKGCLG